MMYPLNNLKKQLNICFCIVNIYKPSQSDRLFGRFNCINDNVTDLHVTGDEVWVMANTLPTWIYSRLDTNDYNFYVYR